MDNNLSIRGRLVGSLGILGGIIWYIICIALAFAPLYVLSPSWWVWCIIIIVYSYFERIGSIVMLGAWIWSFFIIINRAFDLFTVFYIVAFVFYLFASIIPFALKTYLILMERYYLKKVKL